MLRAMDTKKMALNFPMLMAARIGVACAHSIFWSIAAPMATRLVTRTHRPLALSMIVTGSAVAMIVGLPLGRVIGLYAGWRMTFLVITVTALAVLIYLAFVFPKLASDASFSRDDLPKLLKNPVVISVYVLSVLFATAYFTAYSYIEPFLKTVAAFSDQGITSTLMLLGVSGLLGSFVFSRFYNHFRYGVIRAGLLGLVIPFLLWQAAAGRAGQGRWSSPVFVSGNHANEVSRFIAMKHKSFKNLINILSQTGRYMHSAQIIFVYLVRDKFIGDFGLIQQTGSIGLIDFHRYMYIGAAIEKNCY